MKARTKLYLAAGIVASVPIAYKVGMIKVIRDAAKGVSEEDIFGFYQTVKDRYGEVIANVAIKEFLNEEA